MKVKTLAGIAILTLLSVLALFRMLTGAQPALAAEEEAVIVTIKLHSGDIGNAGERDRISALEEELSHAIEKSSAGELDGDEYGGGACTIYMYGPSAERLLSTTLPILKKFHAASGSYVTKRYGKPGAKQDRIPLGHE